MGLGFMPVVRSSEFLSPASIEQLDLNYLETLQTCERRLCSPYRRCRWIGAGCETP